MKEKIKEVLRRWDNEGMRRDLAYWYDVPVGVINRIAKQMENNEN